MPCFGPRELDICLKVGVRVSRVVPDLPASVKKNTPPENST